MPTVGHALSWGVTISGVLQLALLAWAVRRAGMALRIPRPRLTPQVRVLLARMGPGLVGAGVTQLNLAVDVIIVSLLPPGSASLLYYADRVNQLPLGVIGTAIGTAILPLLSRQARSGDRRKALATLNRALELSLVMTLPAALALAVAGGPIMLVLFGRGAFTAEAAGAERAVAGRLCVRPARLRRGQGAGAGVLRPWRHAHPGPRRLRRHRAQPDAEPDVHGPAAAHGPGAGDELVGDLQRGRARHAC